MTEVSVCPAVPTIPATLYICRSRIGMYTATVYAAVQMTRWRKPLSYKTEGYHQSINYSSRIKHNAISAKDVGTLKWLKNLVNVE